MLSTGLWRATMEARLSTAIQTADGVHVGAALLECITRIHEEMDDRSV